MGDRNDKIAFPEFDPNVGDDVTFCHAMDILHGKVINRDGESVDVRLTDGEKPVYTFVIDEGSGYWRMNGWENAAFPILTPGHSKHPFNLSKKWV
mgnify:CR=1 FL=1